MDKLQPLPAFSRQPMAFWANVRTLSQGIGYTDRATSGIRVPTLAEVQDCLERLDLTWDHVARSRNKPTAFGETLLSYFAARAEALGVLERLLMDAKTAERLFKDLRQQLDPTCPLPMNKQRGEKQTHAFLTGIVNMLIEANGGGLECDYSPQELTTVTREGVPLRTLARRVDGAFPTAVNPIAVWELKEYYYTTTFGSRVADGVYESLLDGMELEELREHEGIDVKHYLMVDGHYTWWGLGKSYLCRIFDMLHMGYVDEVLFGREVVDRVPVLVQQWVAASDR